MNQYLPMLLLMITSIGIAVAILSLAIFLGPKKRFSEKMEPFECGKSQIVSPKIRFSIKFYLIALVFMLFDIEAAFLYPWSILYKTLGWFGLVEMLFFIGILAIGLVYVWKKGALEWE